MLIKKTYISRRWKIYCYITAYYSWYNFYMITFDLQCANGHTFEGWFKDSKAFDQQNREGLISCPVCNDTSISRLLSTFAIKGSHASGELSGNSDLEKISRKITEYVKKNFVNVGPDFAKEALKMHYGVSEPKNIRGVSTEQEEKTMKEEGIDFFKVPLPVSSDKEV